MGRDRAGNGGAGGGTVERILCVWRLLTDAEIAERSRRAAKISLCLGVH